MNHTAALGNVSSCGVDADSELFIVNYSGRILRMLGPPTAPPTPAGLRIIRLFQVSGLEG